MEKLLTVDRRGGSWAIKHKNGYLGFVTSEAEAWSMAQSLPNSARWTIDQQSLHLNLRQLRRNGRSIRRIATEEFRFRDRASGYCQMG